MDPLHSLSLSTVSFIMIKMFDLFHVAISKEDKRRLATKLKRTLLQVGLGTRPADDRFGYPDYSDFNY